MEPSWFKNCPKFINLMSELLNDYLTRLKSLIDKNSSLFRLLQDWKYTNFRLLSKLLHLLGILDCFMYGVKNPPYNGYLLFRRGILCFIFCIVLHIIL